jgi:hypothetical protein
MEPPETDELPDITVALRLMVNDVKRIFEVRVPRGPRRLLDLLPAPNEIPENLTGSQHVTISALGFLRYQ